MDGKKQLLSQEASSEDNCNAIDAPALLNEAITAEEESDEQKIEQKQVIEMDSGTNSTTAYKENTEIEFSLKFNRDNPDKTKNDATENEVAKNEATKNEATKNEATKNEVVKNEATKNEATKNEVAKNEATKNETSEMYDKNCFQEIPDIDGKGTLDEGQENEGRDENEGNNNCDKKEEPEKGENVRRARFSSEIRIEPKAYFQAGGDTVVTLAPASSDDIFQNETNYTSHNSPSGSSPVILNAKPFDHSRDAPPPTFFPLTLFSCLFCCPMIGLFAVYKSYRVNKLITSGEMFKAREASQHARQLGILSSLIGFFFVLAIIAIAVMVSELA